MNHAPIALFVYKRAELTQMTLEALARNEGAQQSDLIIFSDGAKGNGDEIDVAAARAVATAATGFRSVKIVESPVNRGLSRSIIEGVSSIVMEHGRVIVVEDDIITSPYFLRFMNEALELYANEAKVAAISGYTLPSGCAMPETFFLQDSNCWGWATWRRAWSKFEPDGSRLLARIEQRKAAHAFDHDGSFRFTQMLQDQIAGKNDSWAIRWRASLFLEGWLSLYPGQSLTSNVGNDGRGTHTGMSEKFWETQISDRPINVTPIPLVEDLAVKFSISRFYRSNFGHSLYDRIKRKIKFFLGIA